jgi:hypothetical protein
MPRITEITGAQSPIAALLKDGLTSLSGDQHVVFHLYRKFQSPLDGLIYWLRVLPGSQAATSQLTGGLANKVLRSGESVQAVQGGIGAKGILGGKITNPLTGFDQNPDAFPAYAREELFVSIAGPASHFADEWTVTIPPGESFDIPPNPEFGVWVSAKTAGHRFSVTIERAISALSGQPLTISQGGSLHHASETGQEEDNVTDTNHVVFTSKDEVKPFNLIGPNELYVGERTIGVDGDTIRFSFSSRGNYYEAADLWHYIGVALQSYMEPLVIDDPVGWEPDIFITNSIPIWLTFPGYVSPYPALSCPFPVFPSYLIPDNVKLPYAAIHVDETRGLAALPTRGRRWEHDQLVSDRVKVTMYGANARQAADFYDFTIQFMTDSGKLGLMEEIPELHDEHMKQVEFRVLAQKKVISFEVSYLQSVARDMARQIIMAARVQFQPPVGPEPLLAPIVESADVVIDCPISEADVPQVTEKLFRAATMPIMTQAMKPPPLRPRTEPLPPVPPVDGGEGEGEGELPPGNEIGGQLPRPFVQAKTAPQADTPPVPEAKVPPPVQHRRRRR